MFLSKFSRAISLVAGILVLTGAMSIVAQDSTPNAPFELRVMSFNIWVGGHLVDFGKVVEAIELAEADVVGLQEATGSIHDLADALGWQYANERTQIMSRYPLIDPPGADGSYVFVQVRPGQVAAVVNVHLPSDPYGPYAVRDGAALDEVLELERSTRLPAIEPYLAVLSDLMAANIPVFLTGDFNTPSHRDWTEAVVAVREEVKYAVDWPVSLAVEETGMVDTYRVIYPDPVAAPGITWTYGYPNPRINPDEVIDRIDLVFASPDVEVLNSQIVGEADGPNVDIGVAPFPSDHRGVVTTARFNPAVPPVFVAVADRTVEVGETIIVRYHAPEGEGIDRLGIVPADGTVSDNLLMWLPPYEASFFGSVSFGSGTLTPGEYAAVLIGGDGSELSRSMFWVQTPGALPTISTDKAEYAQGEPIIVSWDNTGAFRWDWVAIYSSADPDLYNNYWGYIYTGATATGTGVFDASILGEEMLPAGDYVARLMFDDGYQVLAEVTFTVAE